MTNQHGELVGLCSHIRAKNTSSRLGDLAVAKAPSGSARVDGEHHRCRVDGDTRSRSWRHDRRTGDDQRLEHDSPSSVTTASSSTTTSELGDATTVDARGVSRHERAWTAMRWIDAGAARRSTSIDSGLPGEAAGLASATRSSRLDSTRSSR